jgi:epoxyqueuosine reductase QueG
MHMALPIPPKFKRFTEKNDSRHVEKQRALRAKRLAELERLAREREREEFYARLRRQAHEPVRRNLLNDVAFYTTSDYGTGTRTWGN